MSMYALMRSPIYYTNNVLAYVPHIPLPAVTAPEKARDLLEMMHCVNDFEAYVD